MIPRNRKVRLQVSELSIGFVDRVTHRYLALEKDEAQRFYAEVARLSRQKYARNVDFYNYLIRTYEQVSANLPVDDRERRVLQLRAHLRKVRAGRSNREFGCAVMLGCVVRDFEDPEGVNRVVQAFEKELGYGLKAMRESRNSESIGST